MENLLNESLTGYVLHETGLLEVDTMLDAYKRENDMESMIENGNLQDYLDVFGKMEDN
jgi:hypothetical protein